MQQINFPYFRKNYIFKGIPPPTGQFVIILAGAGHIIQLAEDIAEDVNTTLSLLGCPVNVVGCG